MFYSATTSRTSSSTHSPDASDAVSLVAFPSPRTKGDIVCITPQIRMLQSLQSRNKCSFLIIKDQVSRVSESRQLSDNELTLYPNCPKLTKNPSQAALPCTASGRFYCLFIKLVFKRMMLLQFASLLPLREYHNPQSCYYSPTIWQTIYSGSSPGSLPTRRPRRLLLLLH